MTEADLKRIFGEYGAITSVVVTREIINLILKFHFDKEGKDKCSREKEKLGWIHCSDTMINLMSAMNE